MTAHENPRDAECDSERHPDAAIYSSDIRERHHRSYYFTLHQPAESIQC
jgi:hypothetical protein